MSDAAAFDLSSVVSDLKPSPGTSATALEDARRAIASASLTGQQKAVLTRTPVFTPPPASEASLQALRNTITQLGGTEVTPQRVVRREFGGRLSPDPRGGPAVGAGEKPTHTLGPFLDAFNRPAVIDVFELSQRISLQWAGSPQPFLYVELPPPTGSGKTLTLGPGSVWIPASLLATGVPPTSFVGLRIKSGTATLSVSVPLGVSPIVVPAAATLTLSLALDPAVAPTGSGPGVDARAADVTTPAHAIFTFTPAGGKLTSADDASLSAFGTTVALKFPAQPAHYDPVFGRLDFPYVPSESSFAVITSHSTLATFSGAAAIFGAAWSLAITISDSSSLGAAAGAGGTAIGLLPGLMAQWTGRKTPAECEACVLLVEPGLLAVGGLAARAANVSQSVSLSRDSKVQLTTPIPFPFRFTSEGIGVEQFGFVPQLVATLDQPRTVNNARVRLAGPALIVLLQTAKLTELFVEAAAPPSMQGSIESYCLKNLLLKASKPLVLVAAVRLAGTIAGSGIAWVLFNLRLVLPILPDPYATNLQFSARQTTDAGVIGGFWIALHWHKATVAKLEVLLPTATLESITSALPSSAMPVPADSASFVDPDADALAEMESLLARVAGRINGPTLLDLSTNVAQFGVSFGLGSPTVRAIEPSVADLFLKVPGTDLHVVTLPAVQWEPVLTPDQSTPFPSPLTYANSGNIVQLVANNITLVPIAPRQAIDALVAAYNIGGSNIAARFTLPFGITAVAELQRSQLPQLSSPEFVEVQPTFSAEGLAGGDQISIRPAVLLLLPRDNSPSLPGAAFQLHNARAGGTPQSKTVLTPIDDTFNSNFGPATKSPRVPITRIDISGFGESLFSDWRNPVDAAAIISKAQFDVIVGRTSREVVQAYSVLYPYAVRVVRTITIERQNGAAVVRHDSGWQPVSEGFYDYPKPALVTHPGVVRAAIAIKNIRDTGQTYTTSDGSELMAVRFDCALVIEKVVAGSGPDGVPARNQLGYVQLTDPPNNGQLAPDQYVELLDAVGPLGGAIDCTINIGGTGQKMRLTRVGVAASDAGSGPEFAVAAWGSPVLPGGGQWSFLRQPTGAQAPQAVNPDQGVPLVREGPATADPPVASPYLFADPADLLHPDTPAADYGLVHATGTQRLLFPRPKIEASGGHAITSKRPPVLADPYALATATGPFPSINVCIPFPNANYSLVIGAGGNLALQPAPFVFTTSVLKRVLRQSATARSIAYTADENNSPSVVTVGIDTGAAEPWSVNITNLSLATESGSLGEVTRVVGTVLSTPSSSTQLADARFVFGPPLKPAAALVSFLEQFGNIPPPNVSMSNEWQLLAGITFDFTKYALFLGPAVAAFVDQFIVDLDVKMQSKTKATSSDFVMQFELTVKIPTPFPPVVAIGLAKVQFQMGDDGNAWTIQIGVGIGVSFKLLGGAFNVTAYYAQTQFLITGDTVFGLGASSLVKATVELVIVEASFSIEAKIALLKVTCNGSDSTIWGAAQVTIAFEVSIFFVIDIEFDVQAEWTANLDGGPCALPDVL